MPKAGARRLPCRHICRPEVTDLSSEAFSNALGVSRG